MVDKRLWTGIAQLVGGGHNSTALVGTPEQVADALLDYYDLGVRNFPDPRLRSAERRGRLWPGAAADRPGKSRAACGGGARIVIHPERDDWARQLTALRQQMAEQAASLDASGEFPWRNIDHLRAGAG